jgi:hypothetical protein
MLRRGVFALALLAAAGCGKDDADGLARVGGKVATRFDALTGGARGKLGDSWDAARGCWAASALDSRVATRLRWDKAVADAAVQVSPAGAGSVRLNGTADRAQHDRAVELARSTVGVEKVIDEIEVK